MLSLFFFVISLLDILSYNVSVKVPERPYPQAEATAAFSPCHPSGNPADFLWKHKSQRHISIHTFTGRPQGCVLSPLLFSLYTNDCTSKDPSVKLLKFADDTTLIGLIQDGDESAYRQEVKELAVWCSLNNLSLTRSKQWRWSWTSGGNPPRSPPLTIMNSTVTAVESFRFLGTTISQDLKVGHSHRLHCEKGPAEVVLPSPAEGSSTYHRSCWNSFYSAIIESVLCTSITVWFSSATKSDPQKTTEGSPDCWANRWYNPPYSPRNCTYPEWAKGLAKSLWTPHIQHTPSLNCCRLVDATELWAPERPDTGTVLPPSNPSHEHLTLTWNTQHYFTTIYSPHIHIIFLFNFFPFQICTSDLYTHDCLYCIVFLLFCTLPICIFVYCSFVVCVLSRCCHSVALWSFVTITNSSYV